MNNQSIYGLILFHRREWWLVALDTEDQHPQSVYRLCDHLSDGLANWLRTETDDASLAGTIAELNPDTSSWTGEFRLSPLADDIGRHQLDANPWIATHNHNTLRLGRVAVDLALRPLPRDFTSVLDSCPPEGPVLAIRIAASGPSGFEVLTARHDADHRPLAPWRTLDGDAVTDSGSEILGWRAASQWFDPVTAETRASF